MKKHLITLLAVLAATLYCGQASAAQVDFFLMLDGIKGSSVAPGHEGAIQVMSFSWGATQTGSAGTGSGAGAGKVTFNPFSFLKHIDAASPLLFLHCATGTHIKNATIQCILHSDDGSPDQDFFDIALTNVLISSVQTTGATDADPSLALSETMTMRFDRIDWTYTAADAAPIHGGYDIKTSKGN